jgi:quercetin dioxygenase-like cupin family protein
MFRKNDLKGYKDIVDNIKFKTLVYGDKTLLAEFRFERGAVLPKHKHPHEQTGYLVSGRIDLTIGDATHSVSPGDSWCIPENVEHNVYVYENSIAVEVFSPVREDYIPAVGISPA